jgi:transposase
MGYIIGQCRNQLILFPESIDEYVDEENSVRVLDAYVESLDLNKLGFTKASPSETGRPPYSPQDMLKLYIYGYINRIRSSRRLETETKRNIEVMWLLKKLTPDHKTIARFRSDNSKALKSVFRDFVKLCMKLGLYGKELTAIDGSKFKAVNSKDRNFTDSKLKERIARLEAKIEEYMREIDEADKQEESGCFPGSTPEPKKTQEQIKQIIAELKDRKALYESYAEEMVKSGETQKSLTDPDSRLMMANGKMDVCYNPSLPVA